MNDYDFSTLNDKEFENLVIDLISREKNKRFERFKTGRDGGIDGRYYGDDGKEEIIQCKHYLKTGYSGLISSLKKKHNKKNEIDKVKLLNPQKYIFVTSLPLSAANKKEIKELFAPYIKNDSDIYGQEDLNDLLKANPDIEENHYKLWISSTTVLQRIFHNAIKGRSDFLLEEIKDKIKYYVVTENHYKAIEKLESSHTIIIAGEPGIGKTTLAEQIALNYIEKGFEFCVISKDLSEAEAIFERDKKQLFYFDDFLGSNYLNALEAHTDSQIMHFIARIKKDKDKRFILTSRTNIFNQSLLLSDKFRTKNLESDEFIIKVDDLAEIDKAKILYNHIWHSNLSEEYIDELYKEKRYKHIIKHKNFNPRLIEFITDINRINSQSVSNYWEDIQNTLNNPREIWANTFERQSDEYIRNIVALVVFNGNRIKENKLKEAYNRLNSLMKLQNTSHISKEFYSIIEETVKYFLKRSIWKYNKNKIEYTLFNPSIADFVLERTKNNIDFLIFIYKSLESYVSLNNLFSLTNNNFINREIYIKILQLLMDSMSLEQDTDYLIKLNYLIFKTSEIKENREFIKELIQKIIDGDKTTLLIENFSELFLLFSKDDFDIKTYNFLVDLILLSNKDQYSINSLINIVNYLDIEDDEVTKELNNLVAEYVKEELESEAGSIYENEVNFEDTINDDGVFEVIDGEIEQIIDEKYDDIVFYYQIL